jgi:phage tail-like protein
VPLNDQSKLGLTNRFHVVVDGHELGSWSKAEGLDVTWDIAEYRAGDAGNHRWYFPGNTKYSPIRLSRAACEDSNKVKTWLSGNSFKHKLGTGTIELRDSGNTKIITWNLHNAFPAKWSITGFDAGASSVSVETLELVHLGFLDDQQSP